MDRVHFQMKRPGANTLLLTGGVLMTAFLLWFAITSQQNARPVAQALLQGLALSLGQAIENLATRDPSFAILSDFAYRDIAYFALIDRSGRVRFHQNPDLIGETVPDELSFMQSRRIVWEVYGSAGFTDASPDYGGGMMLVYQF